MADARSHTTHSTHRIALKNLWDFGWQIQLYIIDTKLILISRARKHVQLQNVCRGNYKYIAASCFQFTRPNMTMTMGRRWTAERRIKKKWYRKIDIDHGAILCVCGWMVWRIMSYWQPKATDNGKIYCCCCTFIYVQCHSLVVLVYVVHYS